MSYFADFLKQSKTAKTLDIAGFTGLLTFCRNAENPSLTQKPISFYKLM